MRNQIVEKTPTHKGLTAGKIAKILTALAAETGIVVSKEVQRRFLYDVNKTWRVRFEVMYQGKPALLKIENMKLEIDEEVIREKFRAAARGYKVRPPHTYAYAAFDDKKGYTWSIDEFVEGEPLFELDADPTVAATRFTSFYKEFRGVVARPFWPVESTDAEAFSVIQLGGWMKLAEQKNPECLTRHAQILGRLSEHIVRGMKRQLLSFTHPHLAGTDVRVVGNEYIVFANEFFSWRQPGYPLAFPIWNQWLSLRDEHRSHAYVQRITDTWLATIERDLKTEISSIGLVKTMLLNRILGSIILDLPAQRARHSVESVAALEDALLTEANRLIDS